MFVFYTAKIHFFSISWLKKFENLSTKLSTTGGFLRAGNTTFLIGTDEENVPAVIELIKSESSRRTEIVPATATFDVGHYSSYPIEVQVGGATIFVLDVEQFVKA